MCFDMCVGMCADMCVDMCVGMRVGMRVGTCVGTCVDMCVDMYVDTRIRGMASTYVLACLSMDMSVTMWVDDSRCVEQGRGLGDRTGAAWILEQGRGSFRRYKRPQAITI